MIYRSLLFIPADQERFYKSLDQLNADCLIFDLEDSVRPQNKEKALTMLVNNLNKINISCDTFVRVNNDNMVNEIKQLSYTNIKGIVIPKVESANQIKDVDAMMKSLNIDLDIIAIVESAMGLRYCYDIANSSEKVIGIAFGAEDYSKDINCKRNSYIIDYAKCSIINDTKAAKKMCFDTVFLNYKNADEFEKDTAASFSIGFNGRFLIHPNQVNIANNTYDYSDISIEEMKNIVDMFENRCKSDDSGVLVINDTIYEAPHIKKFKNIIEKYDK